MKNILVISSATKNAYVCLKTKDKEEFIVADANCKQAENILVQINTLFENNQLDINDLDVIGVVVGPGSFTGVRIGVALVKGLCAGNKNIKVCPISSLDLIAEHITDIDRFACGMNALSGLVFAKEFDRKTKTKYEEKLVSLEEFNNIPMVKFGLDEENICECKVKIKPEKLLALALKRVEEGKWETVGTLSPVYLRNSQAEENLKKNKKTT